MAVVSRRVFVSQVLGCFAAPAMAQSVFVETGNVRFFPLSPWAQVERPISPQDPTLIIARFSGGRQRLQVVLCDNQGRLLGLGMGDDPQGEAARSLARILHERTRVEDGVERASWSLDSLVHQGTFLESDERVNTLLGALSGLIVAPRQMNGWTLVWSPGAAPARVMGREIVVGRGEWPQLESSISQMMESDTLAQSVQSSEIDRFMLGGDWEVATRGLNGSGPGFLRILRM